MLSMAPCGVGHPLVHWGQLCPHPTLFPPTLLSGGMTGEAEKAFTQQAQLSNNENTPLLSTLFSTQSQNIAPCELL